MNVLKKVVRWAAIAAVVTAIAGCYAEDKIVTVDGAKVLLGHVNSELVTTAFSTSIGTDGPLSIPDLWNIDDAPKKIRAMYASVGATGDTPIQIPATMCLATFARYTSDLHPTTVTAMILTECKEFKAGDKFSAIDAFAVDYTKRAVAEYKLNYNFIK